MSEIRIRRSDSVTFEISSPVSHVYRMASPTLYTVRRVLSSPDLTSSGGVGVPDRLEVSSVRYGLHAYLPTRRYNQHWGRWDDYASDRRYSYRNPKYWSYYGAPPYRPYRYDSTPSSGGYWRDYPYAMFTPRVVRTDYLDTYSWRRYRQPYQSRSEIYFYQVRPWAFP